MIRSKPELPPRAALTIPELLERWGCAQNLLRELIVSGTLVPSIHMDARAKPEYDLPRECCPEPTFAGHADDPTLHVHGVFYLVRPFPAAPHDCTFFYVSRERDPSPPELSDDEGEWVPATDSSPARREVTRPIVAYSLLREEQSIAVGPPLSISLSEVLERGVVVWEEIERFEKAHAEKLSEEGGAQEQLDLQKAYQLLGLLMEHVVTRQTAKVTAFESQGKLSDWVVDNADVRGLGKRIVDQIFARANAELAAARDKKTRQR